LRNIKYIVLHSAATTRDMDIDISTVRKWHVEGNGWSDVGYHYFIKRDGTIEHGRDLRRSGAHVKGYNSESIGICYAGGIDESGRPEDNRTGAQIESLIILCKYLKSTSIMQDAEIVGHRDFSTDRNKDGEITKDEWMKACPCFSARDFAKKHNL